MNILSSNMNYNNGLYIIIIIIITLVNKTKIIEIVSRHQTSFLGNLKTLNLEMTLLFLG